MFLSLRIILPLLLSSACALGPDYTPPPADTPETFLEDVPVGESVAISPWWELYKDEQLQSFLRTALEHNKDLAQAVERINEARAILGVTRADQFPEIGLSGTVRKEEYESRQSSTRSDEGYTLATEAFFELDFWGRFRRASESARASLLASEEAYRIIRIALIADVANTYLLLRDLDSRIEITRRTLASRRSSTRLIRARFERGTVARLDVNQAEIEEADAEAALLSFEREIVRTENALRVLLGTHSLKVSRGSALGNQRFPMDIPAGLPSELLKRRPDIQQAQHLVHSQTALIGVAQALRFPSIQLTAAFGIESSDLNETSFSDIKFWSVGGNLFGPLLSFDRNVSRVRLEEARARRTVLSYEQTVLRALQEVEDALVAVRTYRAEYEVRKRQVASAQSAAKLSRSRYDGGESSYLEVLDAERSAFNSELLASETLRQHLISVVQLYKALGGGWEEDSVESD